MFICFIVYFLQLIDKIKMYLYIVSTVIKADNSKTSCYCTVISTNCITLQLVCLLPDFQHHSKSGDFLYHYLLYTLVSNIRVTVGVISSDLFSYGYHNFHQLQNAEMLFLSGTSVSSFGQFFCICIYIGVVSLAVTGR